METRDGPRYDALRRLFGAGDLGGGLPREAARSAQARAGELDHLNRLAVNFLSLASDAAILDLRSRLLAPRNHWGARAELEFLFDLRQRGVAVVPTEPETSGPDLVSVPPEEPFSVECTLLTAAPTHARRAQPTAADEAAPFLGMLQHKLGKRQGIPGQPWIVAIDSSRAPEPQHWDELPARLATALERAPHCSAVLLRDSRFDDDRVRRRFACARNRAAEFTLASSASDRLGS